MALAVITAAVIGGAVVLDRNVSHKTIALPKPAATKVQSEPTVADTSTGDSSSAKVAEKPTEQPAVARLEPQPQLPTPSKTTTKKVAATAPAPATSRRASASSNPVVAAASNRSTMRDLAPAPAAESAPPVVTPPAPPATPAPSEPPAPSATPSASATPSPPSSDQSSGSSQGSAPPSD
jgi:hypothetical protein